jgi:hypothetical protein
MTRCSPSRVLAAGCAAALAVAGARATPQYDVAICASALSSSAGCQFVDVQAKLLASGQFTTVDVINASATTPSLVQLSAYDAVIVWSNVNFADSVALGNVLADYVDAGGGVVVAVFACSTVSANRWIGGRWQTGYEVILDQGDTTFGTAFLGTVNAPGHALMNGVSTFDGGSSSFRPTSTALAAGATLVASWNDGKVLAAVGGNPKRVDLGFYPPSSACSGSLWSVASDGGRLMANALSFAAGACNNTVASYCTSSTTTHGCVPVMGANGVPSASGVAGFTVSCAGVEGQKSGLFFYGVSGAVAVPWATGSTSVLCVKTPTQRTGAQSSGGTLNACNGALGMDLLAWWTANPTALGAGAGAGQWFHVQAWFRDPAAPKTTNLSDGLRFQLCP